MKTGYLLIDGNAAMGREPAKPHHWLVALMAVIIAQWISWQGWTLGEYVAVLWPFSDGILGQFFPAAAPMVGVIGLVVPNILIVAVGLFVLRRFDQRSARSIGLDFRTVPLAGVWMLAGLIAAIPHVVAIALYGTVNEEWLLGISGLTVITIIQGGAEEVLFRGLILSFLCARYGVRVGVLISAVLFAFWHVSLGQPAVDALILFVTTFVFGVASAVLTLHYGNIGPAIGLHVVWNVTGYLSSIAMFGGGDFWTAWAATLAQPWTLENVANGNLMRLLIIPLMIESLLVFAACRDTVRKLVGLPVGD